MEHELVRSVAAKLLGDWNVFCSCGWSRTCHASTDRKAEQNALAAFERHAAAPQTVTDTIERRGSDHAR